MSNWFLSFLENLWKSGERYVPLPQKNVHVDVYTKYHILCQGFQELYKACSWPGGPWSPQLRTPNIEDVELKGKNPETLKTVQLRWTRKILQFELTLWMRFILKKLCKKILSNIFGSCSTEKKYLVQFLKIKDLKFFISTFISRKSCKSKLRRQMDNHFFIHSI